MIVKWLTAVAFTTAAAVDHLFRSAKVGKTLPAAKLIRIVCERVRKFNKLNCCRSCSEPAITISDTISNLHLFIHTAQFAHCSASARSICQSILKFATAKNWIKLFPMGEGRGRTVHVSMHGFFISYAECSSRLRRLASTEMEKVENIIYSVCSPFPKCALIIFFRRVLPWNIPWKLFGKHFFRTFTVAKCQTAPPAVNGNGLNQ